MTVATELLIREYEQINSHLRANINQFVNWFSFFLVFSFTAIGIFVGGVGRWPELRGHGVAYPVIFVFLLMHVLAFVAILTFRNYISASNKRVEAIGKRIGEDCISPIPVRFCQWMTDLMAAGFVVSYFTWFALLFARITG
jgi:hypothetical protein